MTELLNKLYYMMEDYVGQRDLMDEETRDLEARQDALQDEIILRLGEDGQELMEALADLNLKLETIHDEALFRAAMELGTQIAQVRRSPWTADSPSNRKQAAAQIRGARIPIRARRKATATPPKRGPRKKTGGS